MLISLGTVASPSIPKPLQQLIREGIRSLSCLSSSCICCLCVQDTTLSVPVSVHFSSCLSRSFHKKWNLCKLLLTLNIINLLHAPHPCCSWRVGMYFESSLLGSGAVSSSLYKTCVLCQFLLQEGSFLKSQHKMKSMNFYFSLFHL